LVRTFLFSLKRNLKLHYGFRDTLEKSPAIRITQYCVRCSFRVRHHPHNVFGLIPYPCNICERSVWVIIICKQNLVIGVHLVECLPAAEKITLSVRNRDIYLFPGIVVLREYTMIIDYVQGYGGAYKLQVSIPNKHTRQQPCFTQDLKSITYSNYNPSVISKPHYFLHYIRKAGYGTAPEVIPVRETPG